MENYTMTRNTQFNSLEITFPGRPCVAVREALKALRFRWHGVRKIWYGHAAEEAVVQALQEAGMEKGGQEAKEQPKAQSAGKENRFGVKVGDVFESSWGYEQTNVDFFQVVALVGESSVRVREVRPMMLQEDAVCPMAADRVYRLTGAMLPPASSSIHIKDQEKGDLKRLNPGWGKDQEEQNANCYFKVASYANAHKCSGEIVKTYESWYY